MIMVLGPHKKKTEAMAEAREAQAARKAVRQGDGEGPADDVEDAEHTGETENAAQEVPATHDAG
jgi:translation initiation factor IF-3